MKLFRKTGFQFMLEPKAFAHFQNVSLFLGAFMDRCCEPLNNALIPTLFIQYVRLINDLFRLNRRPGWK